jgi:hypothetical protein
LSPAAIKTWFITGRKDAPLSPKSLSAPSNELRDGEVTEGVKVTINEDGQSQVRCLASSVFT